MSNLFNESTLCESFSSMVKKLTHLHLEKQLV